MEFSLKKRERRRKHSSHPFHSRCRRVQRIVVVSSLLSRQVPSAFSHHRAHCVCVNTQKREEHLRHMFKNDQIVQHYREEREREREESICYPH